MGGKSPHLFLIVLSLLAAVRYSWSWTSPLPKKRSFIAYDPRKPTIRTRKSALFLQTRQNETSDIVQTHLSEKQIAPRSSESPFFRLGFINDDDENNQRQPKEGDEEDHEPFSAFKKLISQGLEPTQHLNEFINSLKLPRALEIRLVLLGDIVQPIVRSLIDQNRKETEEELEVDWNAFWLQRPSNSNYTNAQSVARALEELGVIYVKFGQLLSSRVDIVPHPLADAMLDLHDNMQPFDTDQAREIIHQEISDTTNVSEEDLNEFMDSLSLSPVAAASIGQVYKGVYRERTVAVKVQRPGIRETIDRDAELLQSFAAWLESWTFPGQKNRRLIAAKLVDAVEEFTTRIYEELDYHNEVRNIQTFSDLYSIREGNSTGKYQVIVPEVYPEVCTDHVIVMEWIEGDKIEWCQATTDSATRNENLKLVKEGIEFTLYQLLQDGIVHADPHLGNLLKVRYPNENSPPRLAYLDFGILSRVSENVRNGIVCATVDFVFNQNVTAMTQLFGESHLLSERQFRNHTERASFEEALNETLDVLQEKEEQDMNQTSGEEGVPFVRIDNALISLSKLINRFEFTLPPYFFNNARALVTLEGIARRIDPSFNILSIAFPFALDRLWSNPTISEEVEENFRRLFYSPDTDMLDIRVFLNMVSAMSDATGRSRWSVFSDFMTRRGGRRVFSRIWLDIAKAFFFDLIRRIRQYVRIGAFTLSRSSLSRFRAKRFRWLKRLRPRI